MDEYQQNFIEQYQRAQFQEALLAGHHVHVHPSVYVHVPGAFFPGVQSTFTSNGNHVVQINGQFYYV